MKNDLIAIIAVMILIAPGVVCAGGDRHDHGADSTNGGGNNGGNAEAHAHAVATGGAGGNGGSANGNSSSVAVSINAGSAADSTKTTMEYGGSYTVKAAPAIAAPALTASFSDTCMGSSSFGLSLVGLGATAGTTMVDEACVRRLDSREFRAMGLNDVALALLCQSNSNRKAVEATGRSCPSALPFPAAASSARLAPGDYSDPYIRYRLGLEPLETAPAAPSSAPGIPAAEGVTVAVVKHGMPELKPLAPATGK
jgi:hypothetical protein